MRLTEKESPGSVALPTQLLYDGKVAHLNALVSGSFCIDCHLLAWLGRVWLHPETLDLERIIGFAWSRRTITGPAREQARSVSWCPAGGLLDQACSPQSMNCQPEAACNCPSLDGVSASPKRATCCAVQSITLPAGLAMVDGSKAAATARTRLEDFMFSVRYMLGVETVDID